MTAKDKASFLVTQFIKHSKGDKETKPIQSAKECAKICVDEVLQRLGYLNEENAYRDDMKKSYWNKVKQEINDL